MDVWEEWVCLAMHYESSKYLGNEKLRELFERWADLRYKYELKSKDKELLNNRKSADLENSARGHFREFKKKFKIDSTTHNLDCKDTKK